MELPNYSRQLMQQQNALRKENRFCDCSILVGETSHPAHKLVLAASSMLFKSVLEGSDSISIDTDLLSSQEFSCLLDLMYTGKLPPGKHNLTRLIAAADSLQMFDVAVGCKNILDDLMKQTSETKNSDVGVKEDPKIIERAEESKKDEKSLRGSEEDTIEQIIQNETKIKQIIQKVQPCVDVLQTWDAVSAEERQVILGIFREDPSGDEVYQRLIGLVRDERVLSVHTVLTLVDQIKEFIPDPESGVEQQTDSVKLVQRPGGLLDQESNLTDHLSNINNLSEILRKAVIGFKDDIEKAEVLDCCNSQSSVEVVKSLFRKLKDTTISEETLLMLLDEVKSSSTDLAQCLENSKDTSGEQLEKCNGMDLLRTYQNRITKLNLHHQLIEESLKTGPDISAVEREFIQSLLEEKSDVDVFERLISAVFKDESSLQSLTIWRILMWAQTRNPDLQDIIQEIKEKPDAQNLLQTIQDFDVIFKHKSLILETVSDISLLEQGVETMDHVKEQADQFLKGCRCADGELESVQQAVERVLNRDIQFISPLCQLLSANQENFPQLSVITKDLKHTVSQANAELEQEESTANSENEEEVYGVTRGKKKGISVLFTCEWCQKTFDFKCRLIRHKRVCPLASGKQHNCSECPMKFPTFKSLHQHGTEAHGIPPAKKRRKDVQCDICDKTFKQSSGLLYHKRTEHFEERPFACKDCGAKFAAASSLKNHMRLHTGEKPFCCKHCNMSFSVAAALSYHTKKKHSEGKMYCCQYCSASFAQSIELSRHVRTHTGDKPYVCKECGKGFIQANGLSVHLQNFHNVLAPHDCQKCRVSFSSLDELCRHISEVHPKDLHQCQECKKIFINETLLEKHMTTHDGGKPHSCKICQKTYQTVSGLWYHNRTAHPENVKESTKFPCDMCKKTFSNRNNLLKHQMTNHTEVRLWKCVNCDVTMTSEVEFQQHTCSAPSNQINSVYSCAICSIYFSTEPEFQQHFISTHLKDQIQSQVSGSQTVIKCEDVGVHEVEQVISLDQSQIDGSQQVFVALGDQQETASGSGIVALSMEDLLNGTVTLICEQGQ